VAAELSRSQRSALREAVGTVLFDAEQTADYGGDRSVAAPCTPAAVCFPQETREVAALVTACVREGLALTPRGAGTGKAGGCVPSPGGVVCSLERMTGVRRLEPRDQSVEVMAGTLTGELRQEVEAAGWFYPPDPASLDECTVGGNVATNAGGPCCLKYGVTGDSVLGLEVVLADGSVEFAGRRSLKGVAGYDLRGLFVGSEGTLGVITRVLARVRPLPPRIRTIWVGFDSATRACEAVTAALGAGLLPRALELLDRPVLAAVGRSEGAALLVEVDGEEGSCAAQVDRLLDVFADHGASAGATVAAGHADRQRLWELRRRASDAVKRGYAHHLSEDVAVPVGRIAELLRRLEALREHPGIDLAAYGHAGDGNLHVNLLYHDAGQRPAVIALSEAVFRAALDLGGTLTGEHGIGRLKRPYLGWEQSRRMMDLQRAVKSTFDPGDVFGTFVPPATN
jgi:glycolate oxidase